MMEYVKIRLDLLDRIYDRVRGLDPEDWTELKKLLGIIECPTTNVNNTLGDAADCYSIDETTGEMKVRLKGAVRSIKF